MPPILVILEVLMEVLIPMEMANIIDIGMTSGDLHYIDPARSDPGCYGNVIPDFSGFQLEIWQPLQVPDMQRT